MNYIYEIGYGDYDSSYKKQYLHKEKFSKKELLQIVTECMISSTDEKLLDENEVKCMLQISDVIRSKIFEEELKRRGFIEVQKEVIIDFNDECIIGESVRKSPTYQSDVLKEINKYIDLSTAVCIHPYNFHILSKSSCFKCSYCKSEDLLIEGAKEWYEYIKNKKFERNKEERKKLKEWLIENGVNI